MQPVLPSTAPPPGEAPRAPQRERRAATPGTPSGWPTPERIVRWALGALVVLAAAWIVWTFAGLLGYLAGGAVMAYLLKPSVDRLQGRGLPRVPALLVTLTVVVGALVVALTYLVPFVAAQLREVSALVTDGQIAETARALEDAVRPVVPIQQGAILTAVQDAFATLFDDEGLSATVSGMVVFFTNVLYAAVVVPFVAFFLLKDGPRIRLALLRPVPNRYFEPAMALAGKIEANLGRYFRALLTQCLLVGVVATVALQAVGLDYAVAVGVFTGLANTIPYFGPSIGFLAGALAGVAQTGDGSLVLPVLGAMAFTQLVDNVVFYPWLYSRAAELHPLVILIVVLAAAQVAGLVGMILAVPLLTVARVAVRELLWSLRTYQLLKVR